MSLLSKEVKRNCIKYLPNNFFSPNLLCKNLYIRIQCHKSRTSDNSLSKFSSFRPSSFESFDGITFLRFSNPVNLCSNLNHSCPRQTLPAFVCENVPARIFWSGKPKQKTLRKDEKLIQQSETLMRTQVARKSNRPKSYRVI